MITRISVGALLVGLLSTSTAFAQGVTGRVSPSGTPSRDVRTSLVRGLPDAREQDYIRNLASTLLPASPEGLPGSLIQRTFDRGGLGEIRGLGNSPETPVERVRGEGLRIDLGGGTQVERLRFANASDARDYVFNAAEVARGGASSAIELRGRQVVIVSGPKAADPAFVGQALNAAWEGLPHAPGAPDARAVFLGGEGDPMILQSRIQDAGFNRVFDHAIESSRDGVPGASVEGNHARIALDNGLRADVQRTDEGERMAWVSTSPERAAEVARFAEDLRSRSAEEERASQGTRGKRRAAKKPTDPYKPLVKPTPVKPTDPYKPLVVKPRDPYKPLVKPTPVKPTDPYKPLVVKPRDPYKPLVKPTPVKPRDPYKPLVKPADGGRQALNGLAEKIGGKN